MKKEQEANVLCVSMVTDNERKWRDAEMQRCGRAAPWCHPALKLCVSPTLAELSSALSIQFSLLFQAKRISTLITKQFPGRIHCRLLNFILLY